MNILPAPLLKLVESFERLPGIGPKSAQRLAYHMMNAPKEYAEQFARTILDVKERVRLCQICFNISEHEQCRICADANRDRTIITVMEDPLDVMAFEKTGYRGLYHVLHGVIAPLQSIGPDQLYIRQLLPRIAGDVQEIIIATNPSLEGEATGVYIQRLLRDMPGVKVTRIARGLPVGADVEYADEVTLRRALEGRSVF